MLKSIRIWLLAIVGMIMAALPALAGNNSGAAFSIWPDTGQTKCYNDTTEITCPSPGEDFYGQDAQYAGPSRSYTDLGSGMIQDNVTGLVWEQKTNMDGVADYSDPHDADNTYTWCDLNPDTNGGDAGTCGGNDTQVFIDQLNSANYGDHNDWRLPTIKELATLIDLGHYNPTIDQVFAATTQSTGYWSSTSDASNANGALRVNFNVGIGGVGINKSSGHCVRAVRGGQTPPFTNRYVDNGDTVTDMVTGLEWQKATMGPITWKAALAAAEALTLAEKSDWRLPDRNELRSLSDYSRYDPAIDPIFAATTQSSFYWSSTTSSHNTTGVWLVTFSHGGCSNDGYKYQNFYVRCVRGSQPSTLTSLPSSQPVWVPVYRLYKSVDQDHFYTTNPIERDNAVKLLTDGSPNYKYEKVEFYMSDRPFVGGIPLFRYYYDADKKHFYTTDMSNAKPGYTEGPGVIGYVYPNPTDGMAPLYHLEGTTGDHFYSISKFEHDNAKNKYNYTDWGPQCYVSPSPIANNRPQGNFAGVSMFSGAFSVPFTDLVLNGVGLALSMTRYYNSYNKYELPQGAGWTHSLYSYVLEHPDGNVTIKWGDGTEELFKNDGADNFTGILGNFSKLELVDKVSRQQYKLTRKDQTIYTFGRLTLINDIIGASFVPDLPLYSIEDKHGNKINFATNSAIGRITSVWRVVDGVATAQKLDLTYEDTPNLLTQVTDTSVTPNRTVSYTYNADHYLETVTDARGNITHYTYNAGLLATITYPEGNSVALTYDTAQRVTGYTNSAISLGFDYTSAGTTVRNSSTSTTLATFSHDDQYRGNVNYPDGSSVQPEYPFAGNLLNKPGSVKDRLGSTATFTYDAQGNVQTATNALGQMTTYAYDIDTNNLLSVTDPRGYTTTYTYEDDKKSLKSVTRPAGGVTQFASYSNGLVQTVADSNGHTLKYTYNAVGNQTQIFDNQLSSHVDFTYDGAGRMLTQTDPLGLATQYTYDPNSNVTQLKVGSNQAAVSVFDGNNRLTSLTDPRGKTTSYTYNSMNLLQSETDPNLKVRQLDYDGLGNVKTITEPDGNILFYTYDPLTNRLQTINLNSSQKVYFETYDNNGNPTKVTDAYGSSLFEYDVVNRMTKFTDGFDGSGKIVTYDYDASGNRSKIIYPGGKEVNYVYDGDNRLTTVT